MRIAPGFSLHTNNRLQWIASYSRNRMFHRLKKRIRKYAKRIAVAGITLVILGVLARNPIARFLIGRIGSYALGNDVSVEHVNIGWSSITLTGLAVRERRLDGQPQLLVQEIYAEPRIAQGLRTGVWADRISIKTPQAFIRFDASGNLLSHFPAGSEKEPEPLTQIQSPVRCLDVTDASLSILQDGKQPLCVADVDCAVVANDRLAVKLDIGEMLGTSAQLLVNVDARSWEGRTSFELRPLHIDCKRLSELPLAPPALGLVEFSTDVYAAALLEHPPNDLDWRHHNVALRVDITNLRGKEISDSRSSPMTVEEIYSSYLAGGYSEYVSIRAKNQGGHCSLKIDGPVCGGHLQARAASDLKDSIPELQATLDVSKVDIGSFVQLVSPGAPISAIADVQGQFNATLQNGSIDFEAALQHTLQDISLAGISSDPLQASASTRGRYTTNGGSLAGYLHAQARSTGVNLSGLRGVAQLDDLSGRVSFAANAAIPLASVANPDTYTATCDLHTTEIAGAGLQSTPTKFVATLKNGRLSLDAPGTTVTVRPASARAEETIASLARLGPKSRINFSGHASASLAAVTKPAAWNATAALSSNELSVANETVDDLQMYATVSNGIAELQPIEITWRETRCRLGGKMLLNEAPVAEVAFEAYPIPLHDIGQAISQFSTSPLVMSGTARAQGTGMVKVLSREFQANGTLQLSDSKVQQFQVGDAQLAWSADPNAVQLQSSSHDLFGGQFACGAILRSLDWTTTQVVATCENIQLNRLVPRGILPTTVNGQLLGRVTLNNISAPSKLDAAGELRIADGKLGNIPFSLNASNLKVVAGQLSAQATGQIADGSLEFNATASLPELLRWQSKGAQPEHIPVELSAKTTSISARPFIATFDTSRQLRDLRASGSVSVVRNRTAIDQGILCYANAVVDYVGYKNSVIANRLSAEITARPSGVQVRRMSGKIAGGNAQGELDVAVSPLSGRYRLSLENASLRRALAPIPSLARDVSGAGSIAMDGRLGNLCTANIRLKASNVVASGLAIREFRMPLTADYQIAADRATWRTRGASVQLGGGTISIDSEGSLAKQLASFTTGVRIHNLDTAKLMRGKSVNAGIVNGSLNLRARRARAPEDIVGNFDIELTQLQGFEVPGFDQLLSIAKMPSFTANKLGKDDLGIIHGRLGGGLIHIDDATLSKSGILVLMDGTATLAGRLNMDITALTNQSGPADGLVDFANSPLMLAAPAPVALIAKANDALKDRVIHAAVTGTASRPTIHVQPGKSLSQDTLRFILSTAVGNKAANMAVRRPSQNSNR